MSVQLSACHIPILLAATVTFLGGIWALFAPAAAMRELGLPESVAGAPSAHPVMMISGARATMLGTTMFFLYSRGMLAECDTLLALISFYLGCVDSYVCWSQGMPGKAMVRLVSSWVLGACGLFGLTAANRKGPNQMRTSRRTREVHEI
ncbi:hypothetical protein NQ176_g754 [Zarea fungicola]|uniref:Uncharacterized protein n=1 Tax=Zarea fungicola TaxID=93591 RepID=A0ACC1NVK8_9HYPO|nr:hypothetical protein NQ176_g754 [Lecanicillium fungicola]